MLDVWAEMAVGAGAAAADAAGEELLVVGAEKIGAVATGRRRRQPCSRRERSPPTLMSARSRGMRPSTPASSEAGDLGSAHILEALAAIQSQVQGLGQEVSQLRAQQQSSAGDAEAAAAAAASRALAELAASQAAQPLSPTSIPRQVSHPQHTRRCHPRSPLHGRRWRTRRRHSDAHCVRTRLCLLISRKIDATWHRWDSKGAQSTIEH